ncbi:MAG: riboflavin synthase [Solirubrobacterales bacterium]|mgnify:CR=1 FL=1|nr:riboflavin synthase [Solirubrobacterales bacterium]HRV59681.1 riboflavin synthase [Solirubrobacterales bacterium]
MFSGLVQDLGEVESVDLASDGARIRVKTRLSGDIALGDSIAVNGCCLTATTVDGLGFTADAMQQTLDLTSIGELQAGSPVNLELALRADDRLGGHIVQGHVDGTAEVLAREPDGFSLRLRISLPEGLARYVIPQGSLTIEGVSLTVADCGEGWAEVALIPETQERTNLGTLQVGSTVNIECDVIAKYVERMVSPYARGSESHTDR